MAQFTEIGVIATVKNLTTFTGGMSHMREQMGLTGRSAQRLSGTFGGSMSQVGRSVLNAGRTLRAFGNEVTFLGFQLTFLATGAFAALTQMSSEFESTMVRMSTLANVAAEDLDGLAQAALRLGPELGVGPTELADAMFDIVSSGFSATEALEIIESTAKGAAIGLGDVRTVTDAVTSAMRAFADDGLTASRATDILVQAVREGKGEVDQLAGTIGRVLGIASELGVTFEETAAFIATFTRVGVPAEVAVTSLRSALTNILKPTQGARDALAEYGVTMEFVQDIIRERGLFAGLTFLADVLEDDSEAFGRVIGSARGLAGVLINTGPLLEDYNQILSAIEGNTDQTNESFDLFAQTTEFKLNRAITSLQATLINVAATFRPIINAVLDAIPRMTEVINEFVNQNPGLFLVAGAFAAIAAAAGPLLIIGGLLITSLGTLISAFGALIVTVSALVSPLGLVLAVLAPFAINFVGIFATMLNNTREELDRQGRSISQAAFAWGRNIIVQFARGIAAAITVVIQAVTAVARVIADLLRPGSPPKILPQLPEWGREAMESYLEGWGQADFNIFQDISSTLESFLRTLVIPEVDVVPTILNIRTQLAGLIDTFREVGQVSAAAVMDIASQFGEASGVIARYIGAVLRLEKANKAVERAQAALNAVQEKYNRLLEPINEELDAIARRRQEVIDQMRIEELQAILADPNAPELVRELAAMELREIELRNQQQAIEDTRDAEVDRAQEALDNARREQELAEARVQALQQFIQVQEQNNNLIREQLSLLERLAERLEDIGGISGLDTGAAAGGELGIDDTAGALGLPDTGDIDELVDMYARKLGAEELGLETGGLGDLTLFGDITAAAEEFVTTFTEEFSGIGEDVAAEFEPAIEAFEELRGIWEEIAGIVSEGIPPDSVLGEVTAFLDELTQEEIDAVGDLANELERLAENAKPVGTVLGFVGEVLLEIPQMIGELLGPFGFLTDFFGEEGPLGFLDLGISNLGEAIVEALIPIRKFAKALGLINELFEGLRDEIIPSFMDFFIGESPESLAISRWADDAAGDIETFVGDVNTFMSNTFGQGGTFSQFLKTVANPDSGWGDIKKAFIDMFTNADEQSTETEKRLGKMAGNNQSIFETMRDTLSNLVEELKVAVATKLTTLKNFIVGEDGQSGVVGQIKTGFENVIQRLYDAILGEDGIITNLKNDFKDKIQEIADNLGSNEVIQWFVNVGRSIAQGIIDGIMVLLNPFIENIGNVANGILSGIEAPADTGSPSRRMIRLGHDIMEGLAIGILDRSQFVRGLMGQVMGQVMGMAESTAFAQQQAPVARPVTHNISNRESSFGPINVYGGLDVAALRTLIRQEVNGAL